MIECGECDARFERDADFALHNHRDHDAPLEFKCFGCLKVVASEEQLVRTKAELRGPETWVREDFCDKDSFCTRFLRRAKLIPGGAATCFEGLVVNFLKVPLACWVSSVAAVQPNSLGNSQKIFYKTSRNKWPPHLVSFYRRLHHFFGK